MKKDYPILEFDETRKAVIEPHAIAAPTEIPEHCVLCFFNDEINKLRQQNRLTKIRKLKSEIGVHIVYRLDVNGREIALLQPGVGAPLAAALFEEVISLGCRKFIACGAAGVLDSKLAMGELLVPVAAVRDEGTSYHYLPPAREVAASPEAVQAIEATLQQRNRAYTLTKTWTTDAIYRETPQKIRLRRSEGCLVVEMEAAALFAVAQFRGVSLGQILYAGDNVSGNTWQTRGWTRHAERRRELLWLAAEACLAMNEADSQEKNT